MRLLKGVYSAAPKWRYNALMQFCGTCGGDLIRRIPAGDTRVRDVCPHCSAIHYQNPKLVAGCLATWEGRVLLCRRAIEPRLGFWTLPAGFMENEETTNEAAARETIEEAQARVAIEGLYTVFNLPHISQVYFLFRARLLDLAFGPGTESLEVALFDEHEIPWDELAFPAVQETLKLYYEDRKAGHYPFRMGDLLKGEQGMDYRVQFLFGP